MHKIKVFLATLALTVLVINAGERSAEANDRPQSKTPVVPTTHFNLLDLSGIMHDLGQNDQHRVRAFVFLSKECPISNGYTKTLNDLHARFSGKGVDLFGVVADSNVTRTEVAKHYADFKAAFPILFDASGLLLQALKPTHVPEAFVLDRDGRLVYRGAIDNAWEALGRRRPKAEKHFFADAVAAEPSSFPATKQGAIDAADAGGMHHQGFDLARDKTKSKPTTTKPGEPGDVSPRVLSQPLRLRRNVRRAA
jgi:peroxiredoxin